jgi:hypothetical protein
MSIIRVIKNKNYTVINNTALKDETLSAKAKGIYAYLMSLPDNWELKLSELKNHFTDGRDSINNGVRELISAGYITKEWLRDSNKKFIGINYTIHESLIKIEAKLPETDFQYTAKLKAENRPLLNTNKTNTISIDKENNKEKLSKRRTETKPESKSENSKLETLFDERLEYLRNAFKAFKCSFSSAEAILTQARKFFKTELEEEIITALIDYWKKYKPNTVWNSGAWFYSEFLPKAYESFQNKIESAKLEAEQMKSNAEQRMKSDEQQNLQYQKDLELQKAAMEKFYSLPRKPQMNIISKFNNEHKSKVGISIKNKIITGENPVNVIWFKNYLVSNLLSI